MNRTEGTPDAGANSISTLIAATKLAALFAEAQRELPSIRHEAPETIDAFSPLLAHMRESVQRIAAEAHS